MVFNNLHSQLRDLSIIFKPIKENSSKEIKFGGAQLLNIILQHWFPINPNFQLSKSEDEDEDKNSSSIKPNLDLKCKGLIPFLHGELIDLNNPPQMQ
jgi:hypothetical protein